MQDQEGFDDSDRIELVEFDYRPLHVRSEIKKKPNPKAQESWLAARDASRGEWALAVVAKEPQSVVFSSDSTQVIVPESQLQFHADFQSSNLELVIRRRFLQYELYMRPDTNTEAYYQWFHFRVKSSKAPKTATFTIKNFLKAGMLYSEGLKPFYRRGGKGNYQQLSSQVHYYENIPEDSFCLKFSFQFLSEGEQVQFCCQPPYSYSKMTSLISELGIPSKTLCRSMLSKKVPYLTFNQQKSPKAIIIAIARQHPGESVGSWMMDGVIRKLAEAKSSIQWIVVPMMCVDGVILGNNRTGLAGHDFNRYWNIDQLSKKERTFPEIVGVLNIIKQIRRLHPRKPKLFLDLHGHSSQPNIFTYGPPHESSTELFLMSRVLPELLSLKNPNFSLQQCSYMIKPDKKNTVRGLLYSSFLMPFVYTIEASFGIMRGKPVNQLQYVQFGSELVEVAQEFMLKYVLGEKGTEVTTLLEAIKARGQQIEAVEYDSDDEREKSPERKLLAVTDRGSRARVVTQYSMPNTRKESESHNVQLFKVEETNLRYMRPLERKRTQTEVTIDKKKSKVHFLPRLKESSCNQKVKLTAKQEQKEGVLMNIKEIQKRLNRLKNSRIGKKILIINSYGS